MCDSHKTETQFLFPHQLGWLRRPELDTPLGQVWEKPDGKLYIHGEHSKLIIPYMKGGFHGSKS